MTNQKTKRTKVSKAVKPKMDAVDIPPVVFDSVPARLAMMGQPENYKVCVEEIRRRTEAPEFMNNSGVAGYLKRQKTVNDGAEMRQKLAQHGIEIEASKRKGVPLTTISSVCESEMKEINQDLREILDETYPTTAIAKRIFAKATSYEHQKKIVNDAINSLKFTDMMMKAFNSSKPAIAGQPEVKSGNETLDREMSAYSSHTHGFGPENFRIWNDQNVKIFKALAQMKPDPAMFVNN